MNEEKEIKKEDKQRCLNCSSALVYIRIKTKQRVCRNCGFIENLEKIEDKK